jgi:glutamyl-tRNA synthetase
VRLRVEDLEPRPDNGRFEAEQRADLAALGLDWDGPVVRQSERIALYEEALERLETYPCFCTRAEIRDAASAPHGVVGWYPGTCRSLSAAERAALEASGRPPALRVKADGQVDDFVLRRGDGAFAYNFAVMVDDADQGVDQVVRGADLADSTPRQAWLARTLGLAEPEYIHVPLVLGPDGARLSKRHGDVGFGEGSFRWIASSLGLSGGTARELLEQFDPAGLPTEPSVFRPH